VIGRFLDRPAEQSFYDLFVALSPKLVAYFRRHGRPLDQAEELAQDVLLRVYRQVGTLRDRALFRPWVYRIARNAFLESLRVARRDLKLVGLDDAEIGAACVSSDSPLLFLEWMKWLSPEEREIMTLRYVDGFECAEIGAALELPTGTVQWKIFNAKRKLAPRVAKDARRTP